MAGGVAWEDVCGLMLELKPSELLELQQKLAEGV